MEQDLHVVFGTGPLGRAVINELVARGRRVRAVNRRGAADLPASIEMAAADASDPAQARAASAGAAYIYNCLNAPYTQWPEVFPALQAGVLSAAEAVGAKLIVAENLYMYGPVAGPLTEELPYVAKTRKGATRARMAEELLAAHAAGRVQVVMGRASDFFGPGVRDSMIGERIFEPALAGGKVQMLGDLDAPHTITYVGDFGRALVTLGGHDAAYGQAWHVPSAPTLTTRQFIERVYEEAGTYPQIGGAPGFAVRALGLFSPIMREIGEMLYEFEEPFVVDHSRYAAAFGVNVTPHREAIRRTLDWYRGESVGAAAAVAAGS